MFSRRHLPFQVFIMAVLAILFLPRLTPEGMFPDALTYASIARNMAEGRGSFWSPYLSKDFWIPFQGQTYAFYGHPPLGMGLMAVFFKCFGDHWFIEKAYSALIWLLSIALIVRLWQQQGGLKELAGWALLAWYAMPVVLWAYPFAMLDNTMAVFSWAAVGLGFQALKQPQQSAYYWVGSGLLVHLAFLTKGPVGLFPLALPLLYYMVLKSPVYTLKKALIDSLWQSVAAVGTFALWFLYAPSSHYLSQYFYVQLGSSIGQNDQTERWHWADYFDILGYLGTQLAVIGGLSLVLWLWMRLKKAPFRPDAAGRQQALLHLAIGLSGSLPLLVSHKTSPFYLVPCLPFFALAFAHFWQASLLDWQNRYTLSALIRPIWVVFFGLVAGVAVVLAVLDYGKKGRDKEILNDTYVLRQYIDERQTIAVFDSTMREFTVHAYFQRYHKWELTRQLDTPQYALINARFTTEKDSIFRLKDFEEIKDARLQRFRFFRRAPNHSFFIH